MARIAIVTIKFYQYFVGNLIRHNVLPLIFISQCRFYPSCSDYALEAIEKHGFWRGSLRGLTRILKCSPLT